MGIVEIGRTKSFKFLWKSKKKKANFLQYYLVVSAIPKRLWSLGKGSDTTNKSLFTRNGNIFSYNESTQINLYKAKSKDFDNLRNVKIHNEDQTSPKRWSKKTFFKERHMD